MMFTLWGGFQDAIGDPFWNKPPLEHGVISTSRAQNPLEIVGPAHVGDMGWVTNVFPEFSSWKQQDNCWYVREKLTLY